MPKTFSPLTIRKSVAILIIKIATLQLVVVLLYLLIRLSKYWVLRQIFTDNNYHDLNFWLGIAVFIVILVVQTAFLVALVLEWFYEYYEVRKDLIVHTRGVLHRKEDLYSLKTVEAGNVRQSLVGKICNYGTVRIYSPVLRREYFLDDIPSPHKMRTAVLDLLSAEHANDKKIIPKDNFDPAPNVTV